MDPITIAMLLGTAGAGAISAGMGANEAEKNREQQQQIMQQNVGTQTDYNSQIAQVAQQLVNQAQNYKGADVAKGLAADSNAVAQGDRTDAYGNVTSYNPATHGVSTKLSGPQADIAKGYQDNLQSALTGYANDKPPSEDAIASELTGLMTSANAQGSSDRMNAIGRQALRMDQGGNIPAIIKAISDNDSTKVPGTLLNARNQAVSEEIARQNAHNSQYLPAIASFSKNPDSINTVNASNQDMSNKVLGTEMAGNAGIQSESDNDVNRMIQALGAQSSSLGDSASRLGNAYTSGANTQNAASKELTTALQKTAPDLKGIAALYTALNGKGAAGKTTQDNSDVVNNIMSGINEDAATVPKPAFGSASSAAIF